MKIGNNKNEVYLSQKITFGSASDSRRRSMDAVLILFSSVLFILSLSLRSVSFFSFFCLIPFFFVIEKTGSWKRLFMLSFQWGVCMAVGVSYWLYYAIHVHYGKSIPFTLLFMGFLAACPIGILYGIFSMAYRFMYCRGLVFYAAVAPSLWIVVEYLREALPVFLPWGLLGYSITGYTILIQIADLAGVYGVSFFIVLTNSLLFYTVKTFFENGMGKTPVERLKDHIGREIYRLDKKLIAAEILAAIWISVLIYGNYALTYWHRQEQLSAQCNKAYSVTIVQGNFSQKERWRDDSFEERLQTHILLSGKRTPADHPGIILWPETVLNSPRRLNKELFYSMMAILNTKDTLITGGLRKGGESQIFNTSWFIAAPDTIRWYDKNILLPYAETNPMNTGLLGRFSDAPPKFAIGSTPPVVDTGSEKFGISICFESIYSGYVMNSARGGARILVNLSNDTWFGDTTEPCQHLQAAILRAVENRRYLLRAANSGISAVISPAGRVIAGTRLFERRVLESSIVPVGKSTFYQWSGYLIVYFALAALIMRLVLKVFKT